MKEESIALIERGNSLEVQNAADYGAAAEFLKGATALDRRIQEHYKPLKQKAYDAWQAVIGAEKEQRNPIVNIIDRVKGVMLGYERRQRRLAEEQQQKLQKQADKRAKPGEVVPQVQVQANIPKAEGLSNRTTWSCEIVDPDLIPREYLTPDTRKLNDLAKRMQDKFNVPGCKAVADVNVIVKGV